MKVNSISSTTLFWHFAKHSLRVHYNPHASLRTSGFHYSRPHLSASFEFRIFPTSNFRKRTFSTVNLYTPKRPLRAVTAIIRPPSILYSQTFPPFKSSFSARLTIASACLKLYSTSGPESTLNGPPLHESSNRSSNAHTPIETKDAPIIIITTPSSGAITLPATSLKISQRLRSHHAKEELLAQSSNILHRMWIRLKWFIFRQVRPLNFEEISAIFSWLLLGNIVWILVGTTTFCSIILFAVNTVFAQEYIAERIGNLITKETGLTVVFENAIVPRWDSGVISFNKVFVSRRPGRGNRRVQKGSQAIAAANAAMASNLEGEMDEDFGNYTQFDLTIDSVSVTLSLSKWMNGTGIVQDMEVKGLRGIVDRRFVHWDLDDDPTNYKNVHQLGDFEIENFRMEDALVTLYQPDGFRPFRVSMFNCDLPRLRKHWLFYDLLSANNMSGTYDNSLFTIHPRQLEEVTSTDFERKNGEPNPWNKVNRLRVDGVNIDHLNTGMEGPFGWIESGNVDMTADVMLPPDEDDLDLAQMVRDIRQSWKNSAASMTNSRPSVTISNEACGNNISRHSPQAKTLSSQRGPNNLSSNRYVILDFRVQLNNSRAVVPLFTTDLTYINYALIQPIVAYINSRETYIPISCQVVKKFDDFEGSWTMYDSRLMDELSEGVYDAFAVNVMDDQARVLRIKKVGFWALQVAAQLILLSLGAIA